ncbi:MAG: histidine phosphatase family protein [Gammaproteobacteria bacterium]|jgi:broad specificity phosphatase PhoE
MKLLLMRHGHTNYNELELCNDDPAVDVHLTERGIRQAQAAAEQLAEVPLERILVSELPRTRQTAAIINAYHRVPIEVEPRLNDIRSGHEGRPVEEYFATVGHDRLHLRPPGGESLRDYKARVMPVLDRLARQPWKTVLLVVHEETLRVLVGHLGNLDDAAMEALKFGNCQVVETELRSSR